MKTKMLNGYVACSKNTEKVIEKNGVLVPTKGKNYQVLTVEYSNTEQVPVGSTIYVPNGYGIQDMEIYEKQYTAVKVSDIILIL
jgi:hypothetical protein